MPSHFLLACVVSDEKSVANLIEAPLYVMICFSLADFKILFVFCFWWFDSRCGYLCIYNWRLLCVLDYAD